MYNAIPQRMILLKRKNFNLPIYQQNNVIMQLIEHYSITQNLPQNKFHHICISREVKRSFLDIRNKSTAI